VKIPSIFKKGEKAIMKRPVIFYNIDQSNFTFSTDNFVYVFSSLF